jgi:hypothetical protein
MKIRTEIEVYESNDCYSFAVESHHIKSEFVVLKYKDKEIVVSAAQLRRAIENATNWSR